MSSRASTSASEWREGTVVEFGINQMNASRSDDNLVVGGKKFTSRLMVGTGKYKDFTVMREAIAASGAEIVTVSIRRVEIGAPGHQGILDVIDWSTIQLLPNTAGCKTTDEAVRVAKLARVMTDTNWIK